MAKFRKKIFLKFLVTFYGKDQKFSSIQRNIIEQQIHNFSLEIKLRNLLALFFRTNLFSKQGSVTNLDEFLENFQ